MLSCRKTTELIEKRSWIGLSRKESIQLKMHTAMCKACSAYQKQSEWLDKMIYPQFNDPHTESNDDIIENKELKERIISKL